MSIVINGSGTITGATTMASQSSFATTIGVGGATPSASGAGITFPATQSPSSNANTLDDYEEGTFTPNVVAVGGTGGGSWVAPAGTVGGYYTKIGNLVTIEVVINNSTVPTYTGLFGISIPFQVANTQDSEYRAGDVYYYPNANWTSGSTWVGMTAACTQSQVYATLNNMVVNGDRQSAQGTTTTGKPAAGASTTYLRFSLTYQTV